MKKFFLIVIALFFFIAGLWLVAVPSGVIRNLIEDSANKAPDFYLRVEGLRKGFFFNIEAEKALLKKGEAGGLRDEALLIFSGIEAHINPLSLLRLNPEIEFVCKLNSGRVSGKIKIFSRAMRIEGDGISIKGLRPLEISGIQGSGSLSGFLWLEDMKGGTRFSVKDMKLKSAAFSSGIIMGFKGSNASGGIELPLELFDSMRGEVLFGNNEVDVKSFAVEGKGIYARARGGMRGSNVNMDLELMTDSSFKSEPLLRMMLGRYMISPGYYLIPLRS